jgi:hemerythrin-like domain-containing protein
MRFLEELRTEHDLIERAAASLLAFSRAGTFTTADARDFVDFFEIYAGSFHHQREERILFPALTGQLHLPKHGPIDVFLRDHHWMAGLLAGMRRATELQEFSSLACEYAQALVTHIDAENSVLLPEAGDRLRRAAIIELPSPDLSAEEVFARDLGESLILRFPARGADAGLLRGEGCVMCPSYGDTCSGIEREWWNEWEWEEFDEHVAAS